MHPATHARSPFALRVDPHKGTARLTVSPPPPPAEAGWQAEVRQLAQRMLAGYMRPRTGSREQEEKQPSLSTLQPPPLSFTERGLPDAFRPLRPRRRSLSQPSRPQLQQSTRLSASAASSSSVKPRANSLKQLAAREMRRRGMTAQEEPVSSRRRRASPSPSPSRSASPDLRPTAVSFASSSLYSSPLRRSRRGGAHAAAFVEVGQMTSPNRAEISGQGRQTDVWASPVRSAPMGQPSSPLPPAPMAALPAAAASSPTRCLPPPPPAAASFSFLPPPPPSPPPAVPSGPAPLGSPKVSWNLEQWQAWAETPTVPAASPPRLNTLEMAAEQRLFPANIMLSPTRRKTDLEDEEEKEEMHAQAAASPLYTSSGPIPPLPPVPPRSSHADLHYSPSSSSSSAAHLASSPPRPAVSAASFHPSAYSLIHHPPSANPQRAALLHIAEQAVRNLHVRVLTQTCWKEWRKQTQMLEYVSQQYSRNSLSFHFQFWLHRFRHLRHSRVHHAQLQRATFAFWKEFSAHARRKRAQVERVWREEGQHFRRSHLQKSTFTQWHLLSLHLRSLTALSDRVHRSTLIRRTFFPWLHLMHLHQVSTLFLERVRKQRSWTMWKLVFQRVAKARTLEVQLQERRRRLLFYAWHHQLESRMHMRTFFYARWRRTWQLLQAVKVWKQTRAWTRWGMLVQARKDRFSQLKRVEAQVHTNHLRICLQQHWQTWRARTSDQLEHHFLLSVDEWRKAQQKRRGLFTWFVTFLGRKDRRLKHADMIRSFQARQSKRRAVRAWREKLVQRAADQQLFDRAHAQWAQARSHDFIRRWQIWKNDSLLLQSRTALMHLIRMKPYLRSLRLHAQFQQYRKRMAEVAEGYAIRRLGGVRFDEWRGRAESYRLGESTSLPEPFWKSEAFMGETQRFAAALRKSDLIQQAAQPSLLDVMMTNSALESSTHPASSSTQLDSMASAMLSKPFAAPASSSFSSAASLSSPARLPNPDSAASSSSQANFVRSPPLSPSALASSLRNTQREREPPSLLSRTMAAAASTTRARSSPSRRPAASLSFSSSSSHPLSSSSGQVAPIDHRVEVSSFPRSEFIQLPTKSTSKILARAIEGLPSHGLPLPESQVVPKAYLASEEGGRRAVEKETVEVPGLGVPLKFQMPLPPVSLPPTVSVLPVPQENEKPRETSPQENVAPSSSFMAHRALFSSASASAKDLPPQPTRSKPPADVFASTATFPLSSSFSSSIFPSSSFAPASSMPLMFDPPVMSSSTSSTQPPQRVSRSPPPPSALLRTADLSVSLGPMDTSAGGRTYTTSGAMAATLPTTSSSLPMASSPVLSSSRPAPSPPPLPVPSLPPLPRAAQSVDPAGTRKSNRQKLERMLQVSAMPAEEFYRQQRVQQLQEQREAEAEQRKKAAAAARHHPLDSPSSFDSAALTLPDLESGPSDAVEDEEGYVEDEWNYRHEQLSKLHYQLNLKRRFMEAWKQERGMRRKLEPLEDRIAARLLFDTFTGWTLAHTNALKVKLIQARATFNLLRDAMDTWREQQWARLQRREEQEKLLQEFVEARCKENAFRAWWIAHLTAVQERKLAEKKKQERKISLLALHKQFASQRHHRQLQILLPAWCRLTLLTRGERLREERLMSLCQQFQQEVMLPHLCGPLLQHWLHRLSERRKVKADLKSLLVDTAFRKTLAYRTFHFVRIVSTHQHRIQSRLMLTLAFRHRWRLAMRLQQADWHMERLHQRRVLRVWQWVHATTLTRARWHIAHSELIGRVRARRMGAVWTKWKDISTHLFKLRWHDTLMQEWQHRTTKRKMERIFTGWRETHKTRQKIRETEAAEQEKIARKNQLFLSLQVAHLCWKFSLLRRTFRTWRTQFAASRAAQEVVLPVMPMFQDSQGGVLLASPSASSTRRLPVGPEHSSPYGGVYQPYFLPSDIDLALSPQPRSPLKLLPATPAHLDVDPRSPTQLRNLVAPPDRSEMTKEERDRIKMRQQRERQEQEQRMHEQRRRREDHEQPATQYPIWTRPSPPPQQVSIENEEDEQEEAEEKQYPPPSHSSPPPSSDSPLHIDDLVGRSPIKAAPDSQQPPAPHRAPPAASPAASEFVLRPFSYGEDGAEERGWGAEEFEQLSTRSEQIPRRPSASPAHPREYELPPQHHHHHHQQQQQQPQPTYSPPQAFTHQPSQPAPALHLSSTPTGSAAFFGASPSDQQWMAAAAPQAHSSSFAPALSLASTSSFQGHASYPQQMQEETDDTRFLGFALPVQPSPTTPPHRSSRQALRAHDLNRSVFSSSMLAASSSPPSFSPYRHSSTAHLAVPLRSVLTSPRAGDEEYDEYPELSRSAGVSREIPRSRFASSQREREEQMRASQGHKEAPTPAKRFHLTPATRSTSAAASSTSGSYAALHEKKMAMAAAGKGKRGGMPSLGAKEAPVNDRRSASRAAPPADSLLRHAFQQQVNSKSAKVVPVSEATASQRSVPKARPQRFG